MDAALLDLLACPVSGAPYDADLLRVEDAEVVEAYLVSRDERRVRPLMAGVAVLPFDLVALLRAQGSVARRTPVHDPRLARFVYGSAGSGYEGVEFAEVVAHYRDLVREPPPGYDTSPHPLDRDLGALLARILPPPARIPRALLVGAGVGRGAFVLGAFAERTLGVDTSFAQVRRARNIAVTREHFFLPGPRELGLRELALDLSSLARAGVGFAVGEAERLPVASGAVDLVAVAAGDARGPFADPAAVLAHARRVLRPGGWLVTHEALGRLGTEPGGGPWRAERLG